MKRSLAINRDLIQNEMRYWGVPGLSLALVRRSQEPVLEGFGCCSPVCGAPGVDPHTKFGIASCSKSMTAALIARLCGEGVLDWSIPVRRYAPHLRMMDPEADQQMTLQDILCHRTGLPAHDALWPGCGSRRELAERIQYLQPSEPFRSRAQYSNLMYAMAGHVAECAAGKPWEELMEEYLFQPLHMKETGCRTEELRQSHNHGEPCQWKDGQIRALPIWNVDLAGPAASVYSTASDMARWLDFQLGGGADRDGRQLLPRELFQQIHGVWIKGQDDSGLPGDVYSCQGYGLGWRIGQYRGREMHKHTGKIEGYSSIQAFLPQEGIGAAVLLNLHSPTAAVMYGVLYMLLDGALGLPEENWPAKFHGKELPKPEAYLDCTEDLFEGADFPGQDGPAAGAPAEYAGLYENPGYGPLRIKGRGGTIFLQYRDMELSLMHIKGEVFRADGVKEDILTMSVPVTFEWEDIAGFNEKIVTGVTVQFEPMVGCIRFRRK